MNNFNEKLTEDWARFIEHKAWIRNLSDENYQELKAFIFSFLKAQSKIMKEEKKLTLESFTRKGVQENLGHYGYYYEAEIDDKIIYLQACSAFDGYCVSIYDKKIKSLVGEKTCTNLDGSALNAGEALEKAIEIANKKLKELKVGGK